MIQDIIDALAQSWHSFATAFVQFVPRLVASTIIFAGGLLVSLVVRRAIQRLLTSLRVLVIAIGAVMALDQLGLATSVVLTAFAITFGALMLGLAIAFGLGGRDAARQLLEQQLGAKKERDTDAAPHL